MKKDEARSKGAGRYTESGVCGRCNQEITRTPWYRMSRCHIGGTLAIGFTMNPNGVIKRGYVSDVVGKIPEWTIM